VLEPTQNRISVLRADKIVPLMPAAAHGAPANEQPWSGILLEKHTVQAVEIPEHEHREFCLHLQLRGKPKLEWWSDGKNGIEETFAGSLILLTPGTRDRLRWEGTSDRLVLSMDSNLLRRITEEMGSGAEVEFRNQWALRDAALQYALLEMAREAGEGWRLGGLYADLLGMNLATLLLRRHAAWPVTLPAKDAALALPKLRRAMEYITENLHRDLRLEEIAAELGTSSFHFARQFRKSLKLSPYQYLLEQRIVRAKELLKNRALSVQQIAYETGWNSPVNFGRAFRQRTGQTPGAWHSS
jgi:AraC family transcriptional regulator